MEVRPVTEVVGRNSQPGFPEELLSLFGVQGGRRLRQLIPAEDTESRKNFLICVHFRMKKNGNGFISPDEFGIQVLLRALRGQIMDNGKFKNPSVQVFPHARVAYAGIEKAGFKLFDLIDPVLR